MKDAYYFSHDGNARNDPKMLMLRGKYKNNGYACYFMILEMMREAHNYKLPNNEYLYASVALGISETEEYIKDLFCYMLAICLLSHDDKWVWSESFLRRMERKENLSKTRREAGLLGSMKKWQNHSKPDGKSMAVKESKGKESKRNERKEIELPEWVDSRTFQDFKDMRTKIRKPMTDRAVELLIADLSKLRDKGHDPKLVLEQSIKKSWQGVFELRPEYGSVNTGCAPIKGKYDSIGEKA